jgi:nitrite reductase (NADH) small subunit
MTPAAPLAATAMTYACDVEDVPLGEGRALTLDGRRIALFRSFEGWFALDDACPHAGGPLADGIVCDHAVICPLHERRFALATGDALTSDDEAAAAHEVEVRGGRVFVAVAGERAAAAAA